MACDFAVVKGCDAPRFIDALRVSYLDRLGVR